MSGNAERRRLAIPGALAFEFIGEHVGQTISLGRTRHRRPDGNKPFCDPAVARRQSRRPAERPGKEAHFETEAAQAHGLGA